MPDSRDRWSPAFLECFEPRQPRPLSHPRRDWSGTGSPGSRRGGQQFAVLVVSLDTSLPGIWIFQPSPIKSSIGTGEQPPCPGTCQGNGSRCCCLSTLTLLGKEGFGVLLTLPKVLRAPLEGLWGHPSTCLCHIPLVTFRDWIMTPILMVFPHERNGYNRSRQGLKPIWIAKTPRMTLCRQHLPVSSQSHSCWGHFLALVFDFSRGSSPAADH